MLATGEAMGENSPAVLGEGVKRPAELGEGVKRPAGLGEVGIG